MQVNRNTATLNRLNTQRNQIITKLDPIIEKNVRERDGLDSKKSLEYKNKLDLIDHKIQTIMDNQARQNAQVNQKK